MAFKQYTDKTSVRKKNSRMLQGGVAEVGSRFIRWWEQGTIARDSVTDLTYVIPAVYAGSPDLIGYDYYGRNDLGWLVMQYNTIVDAEEELAVGKTIILPDKNRVFFEILSRPKFNKRRGP